MLYANDLDEIRCSVPGCKCGTEGIYFHSRCHRQSPTWARYKRGSGLLEIVCAKCDELVLQVALSVRDNADVAG